MIISRIAGLVATVAVAAVLPSLPATAGTDAARPELVSVADDERAGSKADSTRAAVSADGRYVAFDSASRGLVDGDDDRRVDVFVRDRETGTTTLISRGTDGTPAGGEDPSISADGRYVVFTSTSAEIVPGDSGDREDVFVHDLVSGTTEVVSTTPDGSPANFFSEDAEIGADGAHVTFTSLAKLTADDRNGTQDVYLVELATGTTTLVSVGRDGTAAGVSWRPAINADGRYVSFTSRASDLDPEDRDRDFDVFRADLETGDIVLISRGADGERTLGKSHNTDLSADGRYVAFDSTSGNLVAGEGDEALLASSYNVFVTDMVTRTAVRLTTESDGTGIGGREHWPSISPDGAFVAYHTQEAGELVPGGDCAEPTVVVTEVATLTSVLGAVDRDGSCIPSSFLPSISDEGIVVFETPTAVRRPDRSGDRDVYAVELR